MTARRRDLHRIIDGGLIGIWQRGLAPMQDRPSGRSKVVVIRDTVCRELRIVAQLAVTPNCAIRVRRTCIV
ncbi:MAG: hypothetical protein OXE94_07545 [Aestuariivita sp.]|nr:hypothetical protein [Aestuariivita sp.]MCY4203124.1 hypothetical protein [Aestuariivita sp.]